jgi:predicted amidohydrolase
LKVSFLHLEPKLGDIEFNRRLIEKGIDIAIAHGAKWILTPELAVTGYYFTEYIGTDWIKPQPEEWLDSLLGISRKTGISIFLSHPEKDEYTGKLHNSVFVLSKGLFTGRYRKIEVHPGSEEGWSTAGNELEPVDVDGIKVGLLICADTWEGDKAKVLAEKGAQLLIVPAAWPMRQYGPEDRWERRTAETGIPLWVSNRTGREKEIDWRDADSVVAAKGKRYLEICLDYSAVLLFDWDKNTMIPISKEFEVIPIIGDSNDS